MIDIVFLWCRVTPIVFIHFLASSVFSCVQCSFGDQNWWARLPLLGFLWEAIPHTKKKSVASKDFLIFNWKFPFTQTLSISPVIFFWLFSLKQLFYSPLSSQDKVTSLSVQAQLFKRTACPCPALPRFIHLSKGSTPLAMLGARARFAEVIKTP